MEPLLTNRRVLRWLCGYSASETDSEWIKLAYFILTLVIFLANSTSAISSAVFVWENVSIDLEESLYAVAQVCGSSAVTYVSILIFLLRHKITATINRLSEIYNESKFYIL